MPEEQKDLAALITALRQSDTRATREFFDRFVPFLREAAKRLGIPADKRKETVITVLDDVLLAIVKGNCDPQPDIAGYLVVALRNHVFFEARRERRRLHGMDECTLDAGVLRMPTCKDLELVQDAAADSAAGILADVYEVVIARFSDSERELIAFALEHVPAREVADWLGIEHGAAKMRLHRIVGRLRLAIIDEVALLPPLERRTAERLLRRAGIGVTREHETVRAKVAEASLGKHYADAGRAREVS